MTEPIPNTHLVVTPTAADPSEAQLANEVGTLWQVHAQAQTSLTKSRAEMKIIRSDLSRRLHDLKFVLSSPKHLGRYVDEFTFRLNDGNVKRHTLQRLDSFIASVVGRRITYAELTA